MSSVFKGLHSCIFILLTACVVVVRPLEAKAASFVPTSTEAKENMIYDEMAVSLRDRGYQVNEYPDAFPLALVGDIAFSPQQPLPDWRKHQHPSSAFLPKHLWRNGQGLVRVRFFFDNGSNIDRELFRAAVRSWTSRTCLQLEELPPGPCSRQLPAPSLCVGSFGGCWSLVGRVWRPGDPPQRLSFQRGVCGLRAAAHALGHVLGALHQPSRPDRHLFLHVLRSNLLADLVVATASDESLTKINFPGFELHQREHDWLRTRQCYNNTLFNVPVPYDYLSLMQSETSSSSDDDGRALYLTGEGMFQHLLDYRAQSGQTQTHYDLFAINKVYKCDKIWSEQCRANGKPVQTCRGAAYVGRDCTCNCPVGFAGANCQHKLGPPLPLQHGEDLRQVDRDTNLLLRLRLASPPRLRMGDVLESVQFFTIIAETPDRASLVSANMRAGELPAAMQRLSALFLSRWSADCRELVDVKWGVARPAQLRTECLSTLVNSRPDGITWRTKANRMDILGRSGLGQFLQHAALTAAPLMVRVTVQFLPRPDAYLSSAEGPSAAQPALRASASLQAGPPAGGARRPQGDRLVIGVGVASLVLLVLVMAFTADGVRRHERHSRESVPRLLVVSCRRPQYASLSQLGSPLPAAASTSSWEGILTASRKHSRDRAR